MLLIDVEDYREIEAIAQRLYLHALVNFPEAQPLVNGLDLGPGQAFKIQVRFSRPDGAELRRLADQAMDIMREHAQAQGVSNNWRQQVKVLEPQFSEAQARRTGITRPDLARALEGSFGGTQVGLYREQNQLIPIVSRPPPDERVDVNQINDVQIWSPVAERAIPLRRVVAGFETVWQDAIIARCDRKRTITVRSTPLMGGLGSEVLAQVKPHIDAMELPPRYTLEWGGEFEDFERAQYYIAAGIPVPFLLMVFTLVLLFNNLRQPAVVLLTVPLAIIGVSAGLLATDEPFGFMALLGFLSLSGMLIKNAIVLIDEINSQLDQGMETLAAIIESGVSRARPVAMAAATTMLGMIPLFTDPFYIGMAVTIVSGLGFATVLTLVVVPVLYATLYRVPHPAPEGRKLTRRRVKSGGWCTRNQRLTLRANAMMNMTRLVSIVVATLSLIACGDYEAQMPAVAADYPRLVKTLVLDAADLGDIVLPGQAAASEKVELAFQVGGPLVELPALEGEQVAQGQVLGRIDLRDFECQLAEAQADLDGVGSQ